MILKKKYFYCLIKEVANKKFQIVLLAQKKGLIGLDYLFEKAAQSDLESLLTPQGGDWESFKEFFSHLIQKNEFEAVYYMTQELYNEKILTIRQAKDIYSIFERYGASYPDGRGSGSLREKFLKL